ncbi:hypothetical protein D9M71_42630 [compost metagenome]
MRLFQARCPIPFWSKRQTCFAAVLFHWGMFDGWASALRPGFAVCRLPLAFGNEIRIASVAAHSADARRNNACRMRIGSGVLSETRFTGPISLQRLCPGYPGLRMVRECRW